MTTSQPDRASQRWPEALRRTSIELEELVAELSDRDLTRQSLVADWTVAQLLHLASAGAGGARVGHRLRLRPARGSPPPLAAPGARTTRLLHAARPSDLIELLPGF